MDLSNISVASVQTYWSAEWQAKADPRSVDWPFVKSPVPMLSLLGAYLAFIVIGFGVWIRPCGPRVMKNREPFQLRGLMAIYNLFLMVWSFYMMVEFHLSTRHLENRYCTATDFSDDPYAVRFASVFWLTYISKGVEFLDTVIFILRKKNNQVSVLHVYHHALVLPVTYIGLKWYPGGLSWFWPCANSFIHFLMYFYYFVSALGPQFQKYLWWKKYLTLLQLIQFVAGLAVIGYSFWNKCDHAPEWLILMFAYLASLLVLFTLFYIKSYKRPKDKENKKE